MYFRCQMTENRGQMTENRGQIFECGSRNAEVGKRQSAWNLAHNVKAGDRPLNSEVGMIGRQRAEDRGQIFEFGSRNDWKAEGRGQRADNRSQITDD